MEKQKSNHLAAALLLLLSVTLILSCSRQKQETGSTSSKSRQNKISITVLPVGVSGAVQASAFDRVPSAQTDLLSAEAADAVRQAVYEGLIQHNQKSRLTIVDTRHIEKIMEQHRFETGVWSDSNKVADMEKETNAEVLTILNATAGSGASNVKISVTFLNVNTWEVLGNAEAEISGANTKSPNTSALTSAVKNARIRL